MSTLISGLFIYPKLVGGAENYFYNLLKGWKELGVGQENSLILQRRFKADYDPIVEEFNPQYIDLKQNRIFHELMGWYPGLKSNNYQALFLPVYTAPLFGNSGSRIYSTIHDLQYIYYPEFFSGLKRASLRFNHLNALRRSEKVIAISQNVKDSILENYGDKWEGKVDVIHNPVDFDRFRNPDYNGFNTKGSKYILTVANQWPHKNILTLVKAYKDLFPKNDREIKLVLTGQLGHRVRGGKYEKYVRQLEDEIRAEKDVIVTGFVTDKELGALYRDALLFALPSLFEGFGMPAVEAMGFGVPTLLNKLTSLPEVSMGKARYVEDPRSIDSWTEGLRAMIDSIDDERTRAREMMSEYREAYSIKKIAKVYSELFDAAQ